MVRQRRWGNKSKFLSFMLTFFLIPFVGRLTGRQSLKDSSWCAMTCSRSSIQRVLPKQTAVVISIVSMEANSFLSCHSSYLGFFSIWISDLFCVSILPFYWLAIRTRDFQLACCSLRRQRGQNEPTRRLKSCAKLVATWRPCQPSSPEPIWISMPRHRHRLAKCHGFTFGSTHGTSHKTIEMSCRRITAIPSSILLDLGPAFPFH